MPGLFVIAISVTCRSDKTSAEAAVHIRHNAAVVISVFVLSDTHTSKSQGLRMNR